MMNRASAAWSILSVAGLCTTALGVGGTSADDQCGPWCKEWRTTRNALMDTDPTLKFDPTSILVRFDPATPEEKRDVLRQLVGGRVVETFDIVPGLEHWAFEKDVDVVEVVELVGEVGKAMGTVEFAELDLISHMNVVPNDTFFSLQWGLNNTGQTVNGDPGIADADMDGPEAWNIITGGSFVVGMADSGIRKTHEDLAANIWTNPGEIAGNGRDDDGNGRIDDTWGWDFYNNDNNPNDDNGHGTHTAGTVGAVGNNAKGVAGVCWNVKLAGLKIGSASGSISVSAAVSSLGYCTGKGIKLSNHSWGGGGFSSSLNTAITNARTAGHMLICAAGNGGADGIGDNNNTLPQYPASYTQDNIIAVAALNNNNGLASFSNYGSTSVDVGAPGVMIASTYNSSNASYVYLDGTSMATPHVTGVAALVWMRNPTWTYAQVRTKIFNTGYSVPALSGKCTTGRAVDAWFALQ